MAYTSLPTGLLWPYNRIPLFAAGTTTTLDLSAKKLACVGRVHWNGRPTSAKTIDTSGSSKIGFQLSGNPVFDNAGSSIDIGIQGVNTSGPIAQPDGSFTVKAVVTTAADATPPLTTNSSPWCEVVPTTGTASLAHGDLIAVVFDFTTRAGSDSLVFASAAAPGGAFFPVNNAFASAAWGAAGSNSTPIVTLTASDGTIGTLDGGFYHGISGNTTWTDSTNPDEIGMIFQIPFTCKVDAFIAGMRNVDATSDFTLSLYSGAESSPSSLASVAVDAAQTGLAATDLVGIWNLATEITLTANTDYCVAAKATGAGNIRMLNHTLGNAAYRAFQPGGTTMRSVNRNNGTGAFANSSTVLMYPLGVRISQIETGGAAGVIGS